ncbi:calcium-binding protein [Primorskyibacter aestuariivivens]|uniref:EF-hand domain-containing protein n=1 Tax=Primorskyibacter aestuariivivens TaxID=1888912 RepID=UPI002301DCE0|nr:calcium-binding protein [Primorskyibacter aestuariivivens]MDA7429197.1 calcium-binding protein [Primorskyibacter aestuariivivens]
MKRLVLATAAVAVIGSAIPVLADGNHGNHGNHGNREGRQGDRAGSMGQMHPGSMMGGDMGQMMSMMQMMPRGQAGIMGSGMMGIAGPMMGGGDHLQTIFDANKDGTVTPEELRTGMVDALKTYDADGNGTLSLDEFETLHAAHIREMTVDRFQALDADGDGQVTAEEIAAPADRMQRMMDRREAGSQQRMPMMDGDDNDMTDNN